MRSLIALSRDERGTSIVELALALPVLAALLIGMVDISRGYSAKLQLEQAAQRSIETAMQGKKETSLYTSLKAEGAEAAGVNQNAVDVRYWLECNGVSQNSSTATMAADYEKVCPAGQSYARYVTVEISKVYTPMFSTRFAGASANGTYTLKGKAGVRVQ